MTGRLQAIRRSWYDAIWRSSEVEPTFAAVFGHLGRHWRKILATALFSALVGLVAAWTQAPRYVAAMVVIPNIDDKAGLERVLNPGSNSLSNLLSTPFGKSERVTPFQQFDSLMLTEEVAGELEGRLHLLRHIYPEKWDAGRGEWKSNTGSFGNSVRRLFNLPAPDYPDSHTLLGFLKRRVNISEDRLISRLTISYSDEDPRMAVRVLENLYSVTEELIIARDSRLSQARLEQAQKNLGDTALQSNREALASILIRYNLKVIETRVGSPYAALRLTDPHVPSYPTAPNVLQYMFAAMSIGLLAIITLLTAKMLRR